VVSGDFNNHISHMYQQLFFLGFQRALDPDVITHKLGGHLDQIFARGIEITNAVVNDGFDHQITDHKCLLVSLRLN
jgi:endonuclease/exonuclease/phosphatase (EEP) superfamily protein YafD